MSEFMLILSGRPARRWPLLATTADPEIILLRLLACLRDLNRIDARLAAAGLETAIHDLRSQFGIAGDCTETE